MCVRPLLCVAESHSVCGRGTLLVCYNLSTFGGNIFIFVFWWYNFCLWVERLVMSLLGVVVIVCITNLFRRSFFVFCICVSCEDAIWVYRVLGVEKELSWCAANSVERLAVSLLGVACYSACITKWFGSSFFVLCSLYLCESYLSVLGFGLVRVLIHYFC